MKAAGSREMRAVLSIMLTVTVTSPGGMGKGGGEVISRSYRVVRERYGQCVRTVCLRFICSFKKVHYRVPQMLILLRSGYSRNPNTVVPARLVHH